MTRTPSRRTVLTGLATGGLAAVAGCTSDDDPSAAGDGDSPADGTSSGPLRGITVEGYTLVITLREGADIDRVNVIAPDGSAVASREVIGGQTRLEIELDREYQPGSYEVVVEPDGGTTVSLQPEIEVTGLGVGANYPEKMPDGLKNTAGSEAWVTIQNSGTGPATVSDLAFRGGVPNPTSEVLRAEEASGIFDTESGRGERESVPLLPDESVTLYSSTLPFSFEGDGVDCREDPQRADFRAIIQFYGSLSRLEASYVAAYSGAESDDGCSVEVSPDDA
jgi:hypothetical protein